MVDDEVEVGKVVCGCIHKRVNIVRVKKKRIE